MIGTLEDLADRFPALLRLGRTRWTVPDVRQVAVADCGAAALTAVLRYHGRRTTVEEVRDVLGVGRDGISALAIVEGAAWFGLRGRGIRIEDPQDLKYVGRGAILHWNLDHFVVLDQVTPYGIVVMDPAVGRRAVPFATVREVFSGVVVELEPGDRFDRRGTKRDPAWNLILGTLGDGRLWRRVAVVSLLIQLLAFAVPMFVGVVVDRLVPLRDVSLLGVVGVGLAGLIGFQWLAAMVRGQLLLHARVHLDSRLTVGFVDHLIDLPYSFFETRSEGDLMMRVASTSVLREILTGSLVSALIDGTLVVVLLLALTVVSPSMACVTVGLAGLQVGLLLTVWRRQSAWLAESLQRESLAQAFQLEMLRGMEALKAMGLERRAASRWSNLFVDVLEVTVRRGDLSVRFDALVGALRFGGPLILLWAGTSLVLGGHLSLGEMLSANAIAGALLAPLATLVDSGRQAQAFASTYARLRDVLMCEVEAGGEGRYPIGPLEGRIELEQVTFRYGRARAPVLQDVSVSIAPGELVAIVGRSGSGKSTLSRVLLGLVTPESGRVKIDGHDLQRVDLASVRRQMGVVCQTPAVFGQTIRENLQIAAPDATFDDLVAAARVASIHDDIERMPMGYDTVLANGGTSLSGGQRQRLALARSLARKPAVLVLDEATSALDSVTEAQVHQELEGLACTRIVIAHRLSTVMRADRILVLEDGRIVESGRHAELVRAEGRYAELVAAQLTT